MEAHFEKKTWEDSGFLRAEDLRNTWHQDHQLLMHSNQLKVGQSSEDPSDAKFELTRCARLGLCVCGPEGKRAVLFCHRMSQHFKKFCGTKKSRSAEVQAWEQGLYVVHLTVTTFKEEEDEGEETGIAAGQELFLHVGHTNFRSFEICATRLQVCHYNRFSETLLLQARWQEDDMLEVRMLLEFVKMYLDTTLPIRAQLYRIVSDETPVVDSFMCPAYVDVKKEAEQFLIWKGKKEFQKKKQGRKRKAAAAAAATATEAATARPRAKAAKGSGSHRRQHGQRQQPVGENPPSPTAAATMEFAPQVAADDGDGSGCGSEVEDADDDDVDSILESLCAGLDAANVADADTDDDGCRDANESDNDHLDLDELLENVLPPQADEQEDLPDIHNDDVGQEPEPPPCAAADAAEIGLDDYLDAALEAVVLEAAESESEQQQPQQPRARAFIHYQFCSIVFCMYAARF